MSTSEERRRSELVGVRMTPEEYAHAVEHAAKRDISVAELLRRGLLWLTTDPWNKLLIDEGLKAGLTLEQIHADMRRGIEAAFDEVALEQREADLGEFDGGEH